MNETFKHQTSEMFSVAALEPGDNVASLWPPFRLWLKRGYDNAMIAQESEPAVGQWH